MQGEPSFMMTNALASDRSRTGLQHLVNSVQLYQK